MSEKVIMVAPAAIRAKVTILRGDRTVEAPAAAADLLMAVTGAIAAAAAAAAAEKEVAAVAATAAAAVAVAAEDPLMVVTAAIVATMAAAEVVMAIAVVAKAAPAAVTVAAASADTVQSEKRSLSKQEDTQEITEIRRSDRPPHRPTYLVLRLHNIDSHHTSPCGVKDSYIKMFIAHPGQSKNLPTRCGMSQHLPDFCGKFPAGEWFLKQEDIVVQNPTVKNYVCGIPGHEQHPESGKKITQPIRQIVPV
jgi:hypothetical protein